jgi:hypothetical protein
MIAGKGNVVGVPLEGCDERLCCIVPHLHGPVIRGGEDVRFVGVRIVVDVVHALGLVGLKGEVRRWGTKTPDLDGPIETGRCEGVGVLGVDGQTHDVVPMTFEDLDALPALFPIP